MFEAAWEWLRSKLEGAGVALELALVLLLLALGWWLGGWWFLAAVLLGMALLARGRGA